MSFGITNAKAKLTNGNALLETTTDATLNNGVYELALSNLTDTPKVNDYVAFVENAKVINIYKVNSVDTTKAYMEKVYSGTGCLITRTITLDGNSNWSGFWANPQDTTNKIKWGYGSVLPNCKTYSATTRAIMASKQGRSVPVGAGYNTPGSQTMFDPNMTGILFSFDTNLSVRLNVDSVNSLDDFKAYLNEHPITIEYLLDESYWVVPS